MAGWTDYIPDWSSKDKLRLCSVYDALSALTAAVNERGSVIGSAPIPAVNRLYPIKYYVDLIEAEIKSIVPFFVDYTQDDGTFLNIHDIPMWTWETIIGEETEITPNKAFPFLDWVYQRYQIVNKLRWSREFIYARYTEQTRTLGDGWGGTFEAALNNAYSNIETTVQIGGVFYISLIANNIRGIRYSNNECYAQYFSSQCKFEITISSRPFDYDAELYIMFHPLTSRYSLHSSIFDGCGMFKEGASLVYSTSILANQKLIPLIACGDASLYPTSPPLTPPWDGINTWESAIGNYTYTEELRLIRKFTGANGFQFRDW